MIIYLSPQISDDKIMYSFKGEVITATIGGITDTFDFSFFPDGELDREAITTTLPINPICTANRVNGVLSIKLLNFISEDATYEERFPEWVEV